MLFLIKRRCFDAVSHNTVISYPIWHVYLTLVGQTCLVFSGTDQGSSEPVLQEAYSLNQLAQGAGRVDETLDNCSLLAKLVIKGTKTSTCQDLL